LSKSSTIAASVIVSFCAITASAEVIRGTGEPMNFDIGYGIKVNEGSTLNREWIIVTDQRLPVNLTSFTAKTRIDDRNWIYDIDYSVETSEDIQAIEVRFIPFDVWGESDRPLSATDIKDFSGGNHSFSAEWRILSESDAVHHFAMLGYVAQIKLSSGAILRANPDAVIEEARKFSEDFSSGDLSTDE